GFTTTLIVFKKNRQTKYVFFIYARKEFEKGKNQNHLSDDMVEKFVETYHNRQSVDKYAHLASIEEFVENDYNLNIPRY
ncbi:N-6 DNA methylase, partial [Streptococcus suis]